MSAAPAGSAGQAANQSVAQGTTNTMGATTTGGTATGVPTVSGYLPQFVLSFPSGTVMETLDGTNYKGSNLIRVMGYKWVTGRN